MKIAFYNVTASFISGGLETYCWEAGRALARRGHDVTIVAGARGNAWHDEVRLVQFPFRSEKEWPDFGVRFRRLAERLSFARSSLKHLVGGSFDAVIVNKPFDFPILWRAKRSGLKAITLFRSGGTDFFPLDKQFSRAVDIWVSASRFNAKQIEARYGHRVKVIHNGVDTDHFTPQVRNPPFRANYSRPGETIVVSVGRLVGWKGLRVVLEALAGVPFLRYIVVGSGPEEAALKAFALRLGVSDRVEFAGRIPHSDLPRLIAQCDIFVQPSTGEEAFGISVVEAMACGLPVLASGNGGLPEILVDGVTGLLLPPGNVGAWRTGLAELARDPQRAAMLGAAGRARAVSHFTWSANAAQLEVLLLGGR